MPQIADAEHIGGVQPRHFVEGAYPYRSKAFSITVPGGTQSQSYNQKLPSYGFLRGVLLKVTSSGGQSSGAGNTSFYRRPQGYPWNYLESIGLIDTNGQYLYGPLNGIAARIIGFIGGYNFQNLAEVNNIGNPLANTQFFPNSPFNWSFWLYIPVEITAHNALGALSNQKGTNPYRLQIVASNTAAAFNRVPVTLPTITVEATMLAWTVPDSHDSFGHPAAVEPPRLGTTQYWTQQTVAVNSGPIEVDVERVGRYIRSLIFFSDSQVVGTSIIPQTDLSLNWEDRQLFNESQETNLALAKTGILGLDTNNLSDLNLISVNGDNDTALYPFNNSILGHVGDEQPYNWLPTTQATRLRLLGTAGTSGNITMLINDVEMGADRDASVRKVPAPA